MVTWCDMIMNLTHTKNLKELTEGLVCGVLDYVQQPANKMCQMVQGYIPRRPYPKQGCGLQGAAIGSVSTEDKD